MKYKINVCEFLKNFFMILGALVVMLLVRDFFPPFVQNGSINPFEMRDLLLAAFLLAIAHRILYSEKSIVSLHRWGWYLFSMVFSLPALGILAYDTGLQRVFSFLWQGRDKTYAIALFTLCFLLSLALCGVIWILLERNCRKKAAVYNAALAHYKAKHAALDGKSKGD